MKQYDKIWVPAQRMPRDWNDAIEGFVHNGNTIYMQLQKNVIVLTIEELQDLWNAAQDRACALQIGDPADTKIFETYLESKGINIK